MSDVKKSRKKISEEEEQRILTFLFEGRVPYAIGKLVGRDRGVVMRIAKKHKRELSAAILGKLKMPTIDDGLTAYTRYLKSEKRQELLSQTMDKVSRMLERESLPPKDVRDLAVSLGIIVDKFAVETGKTDDNAKAALVALFQKMEQNVTVNTNGTTNTSRETSEVYTTETKEDESTMGQLEEQQVDSS
ncbi:MAG: hypothetical protein WC319_02445 [Candidatus Paceibacterota bacterium]|jgi:hypothetical protein